MWTADDFPGAGNVPWPLLIRARSVYEIDAVVASAVVNQVIRFGSAAVATRVAEAAYAALAHSPQEEVGSEQRLDAMTAVLDYDELCPRWFPRPPRPRSVLDDLSDPLLTLVVDRALDLVGKVGSESLAKNLEAALHEVAH